MSRSIFSDRLVIFIFILNGFTACGRAESDPVDDTSPADSDTDAGSGADSDTDADGNADGDADTDTGTTDDPVVGDLQCEDNPNSEISCYLTWSTNIAAGSTVEFGEETYEFRIARNESVTEHRVLIVGMHAETTYRIRALSPSDAGTGTAETTYTTGALPSFVPEATPGAADFTRTQTGWTLTNVHDLSIRPQPPCAALMYDERGKVVWYYVHGPDQADDRGDIDIRYVPGPNGGTVTLGATGRVAPAEVDLGGNLLFSGPDQPLREKVNHFFEKQPTGNYLTIRDISEGTVGGSQIEEWTPNNDISWIWNIFDHLTPNIDAGGDWCHGNAAVMRPEEDAFYFSCRNLNTIFKMTISGNQDVVWRLGETGDFAPDPTISADRQWFYGQHDPRISAAGTLMIYDNGGYRDLAERLYTRVVEYALDETAMAATVVWEFPGNFDVDPWYTNDWYTEIWGSAYRLENNNVLIGAGTRNTGRQSRIFEVTNDGVVVWEIIIPENNGQGIGIYKAERISPPPVERL